MKVRVSMPGAYTAIEFEEDQGYEAFRKINEMLVRMRTNSSVAKRSQEDSADAELENQDPAQVLKGETLFFKADSVPEVEEHGIETAAPPSAGLKYKGFLYLKCPECGEVHGFCTKEYLTYYKCRSCGHRMVFEVPLVRLWINCECGKQYRYMTNMTDPMFDVNCLGCGAPVAVQWNEKKGIYEPMREAGYE